MLVNETQNQTRIYNEKESVVSFFCCEIYFGTTFKFIPLTVFYIFRSRKKHFMKHSYDIHQKFSFLNLFYFFD